MKTLARIGLGVFLGLTTIVPMSAANASCSVTIYANRATFANNLTHIYGATTTTSIFYYHGSTTNATLASLFFAAAAQHSRVALVGSATTCPTTGTARNIGAITIATISP